MRVAHVLKALRVAGAEQHVLALLAGLRDRQVDAHLLLLVEPEQPMDEYVTLLDAQNIPVQRIPIYSDMDALLTRRLVAALRALQPDVAHTHLFHADLFGIPAARLAGVPVVVTSRHNDDAFRYRMPIRLVNRALWRFTDAAIAISDSIARFTVEVEGAPAEKVRRIHYGLDTTTPPLERAAARQTILGELKSPSTTVLVGLVCRLVEQKGVAYAIEAFRQVATAFPDAALLVAGDGPLREALQAQAAPLGDRVRFLGWRQDTARLVAALDIFLAPSLWEGFGLVLLEAMAQQTPVIASAVSAIPEVVADGETGLLVPPRDAAALAAALRTLLDDAALRQHLGLLGRDRLETHFSAERMVNQTTALYEELLRRKSTRR
ncbi:MAG: glycosyltransferase [Chloroflexi bacterium]|nr:glycosyltransferase [Chloroflexota bacterium]